MLRHHAPKAKDYYSRLNVLVAAGILELPDLKQRTRARFVDRDAFDELSFLFFVAWLYTSIWNRDHDDFRASWVMVPGSKKTILALGRERHPFVIPGTTSKPPPLFIDEQFFRCEVDDTRIAAKRDRQILCPVLNRVRLNLGSSDPARVTSLPPSSSECCGSLKQRFREFVESDLDATRTTASAAVGGQALPIALDSVLATKFATGLEATSNDLGTVFEETLLIYALLAADASMGIPHFWFRQPIMTNEIDFAIYDTHGHKAGDDWQATIIDQSLCAWEVTCGHLAELGRDDEPVDDDAERERPPKGRDAQHLPGSDHPQKKLVNFMALKTLGFFQLHFHYLSVLPPEDISPATVRALENTTGFTYWCLGSEVPDLEDRILTSEAGIDVALLRDWHRKLVERVEIQARAFAATCKATQTTPEGTSASAGVSI